MPAHIRRTASKAWAFISGALRNKVFRALPSLTSTPRNTGVFNRPTTGGFSCGPAPLSTPVADLVVFFSALSFVATSPRSLVNGRGTSISSFPARLGRGCLPCFAPGGGAAASAPRCFVLRPPPRVDGPADLGRVFPLLFGLWSISILSWIQEAVPTKGALDAGRRHHC